MRSASVECFAVHVICGGQASNVDIGEVMSMVYNHGSTTHKVGEILCARDGLAVMLLPNGLLIGDQVYEGEIDFSIIKETEGLTPDRVIGMCLALIVLSNPRQQFRLPENTGVAEGFAKVMHLLNNWGRDDSNPVLILWVWLQRGTLGNLSMVHPFIQEMMVCLLARAKPNENIKHPF